MTRRDFLKTTPAALAAVGPMATRLAGNRGDDFRGWRLIAM